MRFKTESTTFNKNHDSTSTITKYLHFLQYITRYVITNRILSDYISIRKSNNLKQKIAAYEVVYITHKAGSIQSKIHKRCD